jgi:hypothetical protein
MKSLLHRASALLCASFVSICGAETHTLHVPSGSLAGLPERTLALLVSVNVGSKTCDMQVDTGANGAVIWHESQSTDEKSTQLNVKLGSIEVAATAGSTVMRMIEACTRGSPVGTLGNAFFERGTLMIDIANRRLGYEPGSHLSGRKGAQRFFYATWTRPPVGGHILVELTSKPFGKGYGLLDTGAALSELGVLDEQWWTRLVGSVPADATQVTHFTVNSWGKSVECLLTQASAEVAVDAFQLTAREVTYCPTLPFQSPLRLLGLVGMRLFRDRVLTIDYPSRLWLVHNSR